MVFALNQPWTTAWRRIKRLEDMLERFPALQLKLDEQVRQALLV
jgi:hypothetical protein